MTGLVNGRQAPQAQNAQSPYEIVGGVDVIAAIVGRFYDLMESDPAYAELRAMHADNLAPMRASLVGFLVGWTGGPRDWFEERPGACVMSLHGKLAVTPALVRQWCDAMSRAIASVPGLDPKLADALTEALVRMATGMVRE